MSDVVLDLRGLPQVKQMLDALGPREIQRRMRRALRAGLKPIRQELRREARAGAFPRQFRSTRTREHRYPMGVSVSPKSPLSPIFEHGAKPHTIAPRDARALAGKAGERHRAADMFALGPVRHPGMAARPLIAPAFAASEESATSEVQRVLFEGL